MGCELLRQVAGLPHNKGKIIVCPIESTCKQDICLYVSDIDRLMVDQKDPHYAERLSSTEQKVDKP